MNVNIERTITIMNELKNFVYISIISADNDEFGLTEDDKQEIIRRYDLEESWDNILEPIKDEKQREMLIDFFKNPEE
jgi:hypothetical protein